MTGCNITLVNSIQVKLCRALSSQYKLSYQSTTDWSLCLKIKGQATPKTMQRTISIWGNSICGFKNHWNVWNGLLWFATQLRALKVVLFAQQYTLLIWLAVRRQKLLSAESSVKFLVQSFVWSRNGCSKVKSMILIRNSSLRPIL